jgi:hypothetical protein
VLARDRLRRSVRVLAEAQHDPRRYGHEVGETITIDDVQADGRLNDGVREWLLTARTGRIR